ncbi:S24/S26 family peptidase [Leptothoe kymatousa]|uniref:S24/S26 family peptidase n=1 Tax=Leptothoe kymatousa TAU-MAC 1615 TaxID=2364775 RepID=A0ABS5XZE9_9CYAN|nr:S24/S26 family peptidase [Leptothoe kymatousa]MBT9310928.1 S24/S26 family peptidase [Leptothoe kymatousa TAU-MAC 1615]
MANSGWPSIPSASWGEYLQWLRRRRKRFVVKETSMVPTLMPGDTVLAEMGRSVQIGDIAILRLPGAGMAASVGTSSELLLVKRVSQVFYDGGVYVISDNSKEPSARDSRHFGVIAATQVLGRVTSRLTTAK